MTDSLSNLVNNFAEGVHKIKCKYGENYKKCETCNVKYKYCKCFLEYKDFKYEYKYLCCNKTYQRKFKEKVKERLFNT